MATVAGVAPRAAVLDLPAYRAGRSAAQVAAEHGLATAVELASNETPYGPLPSVRAAIADASGDLNRYPDPRAGALRKALAAHLGVDVGSVMVGAGSCALIAQLCAAYVEPGDEVVFPWPSFEAYPIFARLPGGVPVRVPLDGARADVGALLAAIGPRTRVVLLAEPNNPTSTSVGADGVRALVEGAPPSCLVVVDEAYREFAAPTADPVDLVAEHPNVVVLRSFSKAYGLAGLRAGYGVADPGVVDVVERVAVPFSVSTLAQVAAVASLAAPEELDARVAAVVPERERLVGELRRRGWDVPTSAANFVWMAAGPLSADLAVALERRGIVTRPFAPDGLRVTVGTPEEDDAFLAALDASTPSTNEPTR